MTPHRSFGAHALGWLKNIAWFLVLFVAVSAALDYWRGRHLTDQPAPVVNLQALNGDTLDLAAMSDERPVLVYFWATWCGVCKAVSPTVNWLAPKHQVVSIALSSGDDVRLRRYMETHGYDFPVVNDPGGELASAWGITATPSIAVVSRGEIVSFTTGVSTPPGLLWRLWRAGH